MHEEHAKCYAEFGKKSEVWSIQARYQGLKKYSEKSFIYR